MEEEFQPRIVRDDKRLRRSDLQTAGLHREQAFSSDGLWVGVVITEPGDMSAWHHHGDHDSYAYVVNGSKRIEHGPGGAQSITAGPGDFIHVPKGLIHREGNPSTETSRSIAFRLGSGPATINVEGPVGP
ncbi:MAG: cupin domain-containing protein [Actinomycetota bacterium]